MNSRRIARMLAGLATGTTLVLGSAAPALAAKHHHKRHSTRHTTNSSTSSSSSSSSSSSGETTLTGATLTSASTAALAGLPSGSTVSRASTENDSSDSAAAYEVHVTEPDGTRVVVIEDSSFKVLSTTAETGHGNCHGGTGTTGSSGSGT
jgi:hypothetical protein